MKPLKMSIYGPDWIILPILFFAAYGLGVFIGVIIRAFGIA